MKKKIKTINQNVLMLNNKLLIVVNDASFFISHRLSLAIHAKKNGYEVHVAAHGDYKSVSKIISSGLIFHEIPFFRSSANIFNEASTLLSLIKVYKKVSPNIVHHVTIKPIVYGGIAAIITSIPFVVSAISGLGFVFIEKKTTNFLKKNIIKLIYKFLFRKKNNKVIFQNPDERNMLLSENIVNENNSYLIKGAGVDVDVFTPKQIFQEIPVVVLAARMIWDKGVREYVNAATILKDRGIKAKFLLVGGIDYGYPNFIKKEKLQEWNKNGIISWLGFCDNIHEIYQNSSIVCLPSFYSEGIPKSLIEAAACAKPIVTTDMPGCREIVKDGFNGILVPPKNSLLLANALETLINNTELRSKYGSNGHNIVKKDFSSDIVNKMTLDLYTQFKNI